MQRSQQLFDDAKGLFPGGVNSPVRAFGKVGGVPPYFKRGQGPYLFDEDDHRYIDYVGSWGPMILGHAPPFGHCSREKRGRVRAQLWGTHRD